MASSRLLSAGLATLAVAGTTSAGRAGQFEIVGNTAVSAQQAYLGTANTIIIVDKVQNNPLNITNNGSTHPAWSVEYDLTTNTVRPLDIITNSFCAGGNQLGNGTWLNVGGNNAVSTGGLSDSDLGIAEGFGAYKDFSGGRAARLFTPCDDQTCEWLDEIDEMPVNRWYPHVETMVDGSVMIIGGELWGGFVNSPDQVQSTPTFEFFPKRGTKAPKNMTFLLDTQPANLYPLTWLLPNGTVERDDGLHQQLFLQASWQATLFHPETYIEQRLPNITHAQRTYPSGGGNALLPLTPENNYIPTLFFCGGMDPERDDWDQTKWVIIDTAASDSCVSIKPMDEEPEWVDEESLPEGRSLANMILLPDETILVLNGASYGSEGYGWENWHNGTYGQSYARDPVYRPTVYNASAPAGSKWNTDFSNSTVSRLYHSTALLLPDGAVFVAGSAPSADVITEANNASYPYKTEYRAEKFYPSYYDEPRPVPSGLPTSLSYGGEPFNFTLPAGNVSDPSQIRVGLMRSGFATHSYNAGMRHIVLNSTYTEESDGSYTVHVSQVPPNPAIIAPGNALLFVVVGGVPSIGEFVMVGNGQVSNQTASPAVALPASSGSQATADTEGSSGASMACGTSLAAVVAAGVVVLFA